MQKIRDLVEQTVVGLGYEAVEVEFAASGLLRVFVDNLVAESADPGTEPETIKVGDCEKVSRQLGHVLEVENYDYARLEVSSPGADRPLKTAQHFQRFAGEQVSLKLREPFEGERNFRGVLTIEGDGQFGLEMTNTAHVEKGKRNKSGKASGKSRDEQVIGQKLVFAVDEVERARVVPTFDFRRHG